MPECIRIFGLRIGAGRQHPVAGHDRLAGRDWVMGADYTIADISLLGWVRT
jgi:glutathione S-transferase